MTDTLPAGVELVSDASTRIISADLGTIKPGQTITKEYVVKVTATQDGLIQNKACFTGNSLVNDNAQSGCDVADVSVTVPVVPPVQPIPTPTPTPTPTPVTPTPTPAPVPQAPVALPNTSAIDVAGGLTGLSTVGYASYTYLRSKRNLNKSHIR
jgi:hypothetical protein